MPQQSTSQWSHATDQSRPNEDPHISWPAFLLTFRNRASRTNAVHGLSASVSRDALRLWSDLTQSLDHFDTVSLQQWGQIPVAHFVDLSIASDMMLPENHGIAYIHRSASAWAEDTATLAALVDHFTVTGDVNPCLPRPDSLDTCLWCLKCLPCLSRPCAEASVCESLCSASGSSGTQALQELFALDSVQEDEQLQWSALLDLSWDVVSELAAAELEPLVDALERMKRILTPENPVTVSRPALVRLLQATLRDNLDEQMGVDTVRDTTVPLPALSLNAQHPLMQRLWHKAIAECRECVTDLLTHGGCTAWSCDWTRPCLRSCSAEIVAQARIFVAGAETLALRKACLTWLVRPSAWCSSVGCVAYELVYAPSGCVQAIPQRILAVWQWLEAFVRVHHVSPQLWYACMDCLRSVSSPNVWETSKSDDDAHTGVACRDACVWHPGDHHDVEIDATVHSAGRSEL
jgi:hypothetical protein